MKCFAGIAVGLLTLHFSLSNDLLNEVKSGQKQLVCNGKLVEPSKITDFQDGVWFFTNGYAKNCEVSAQTI